MTIKSNDEFYHKIDLLVIQSIVIQKSSLVQTSNTNNGQRSWVGFLRNKSKETKYTKQPVILLPSLSRLRIV